MRVLVLDDDSVVRTTIVALLTAGGYEVTAARTAEEARGSLEQLAAHEDVCCLVVDVILEEESGVQFAREVMLRYPNMRILLISGFTDEVLMLLPDDSSGRISFLRKPFTASQLRMALETLCG